jgi:hypothetical protein
MITSQNFQLLERFHQLPVPTSSTLYALFCSSGCKCFKSFMCLHAVLNAPRHALKLFAAAGVEDVSTERAVCSLLLGNPDQALVLLRLKRGCMPLAPNPDVSEFFAAYGDSEGQQTSAVIDFGERWVSSVLLPMVPFGTPWTRAFDMDAWADLPAVRTLLQGHDSALQPVVMVCPLARC